MRALRLPAALFTAALAVAGCGTVGPDYVAPETPLPAAWTSPTPAEVSVSAVAAVEVPLWWQQLHDPVLTGLVEQALRDSPDLQTARARLREARARSGLASANRLPAVDASGSYSSSRIGTQTGSGQTRELYQAGFDAGWEADLFGGLRRGEEAAQAEVEASAADLAATRVSLAAEVALNYVDLRSGEQRLQIARDNLETQLETLQIAIWRAQAGLGTELAVEQARTAAAQTRALIPALETGIAQSRYALAVLAGQQPGALDAMLASPAGIPQVPSQILIGIPADTLRQRPDLRAAERRLAAQTARIGEAEALGYPDLRLSGSLGLESLTLGSLTGPGSVVQLLAASIAVPVFDGGRVRQSVEIQSALQEQALASYRSTLLAALKEVEDALVALAGNRGREQSLREAVASARIAATVTRQRYAAGLVDFQTVLDTQRTLLVTEESLASAEADSASSVVRLYKAMGGGWPAPEAVAAPQENPS